MSHSSVLFYFDVDVGEGQTERLLIYENSIPLIVAENFIESHKLDASLTLPLARAIHSAASSYEEKNKFEDEIPSFVTRMEEDIASRNMKHKSSMQQKIEKENNAIATKSFITPKSLRILKHAHARRPVHGSNAQTGLHCGERLHRDGLERSLRRQRLIEEHAMEREQNPELTFTPAINPRSSQLAVKGRIPHSCLEAELADRAQEEAQECTFRPVIDPHSRHLAIKHRPALTLPLPRTHAPPTPADTRVNALSTLLLPTAPATHRTTPHSSHSASAATPSTHPSQLLHVHTSAKHSHHQNDHFSAQPTQFSFRPDIGVNRQYPVEPTRESFFARLSAWHDARDQWRKQQQETRINNLCAPPKTNVHVPSSAQPRVSAWEAPM